MVRSVKVWSLITIAAIALVLGACGSDPAKQAATASPTPSETTFTEGEWTIQTPAGWASRDASAGTDAKKAVRYEGANGEFFIVAIDPLGSDFRYDALWRYETTANEFDVTEKYECVGKNDESCSSDDARYDGYILWKSGTTPRKVGGHTWYFVFGNSKTTTIDADMFEKIVESVRAAG